MQDPNVEMFDLDTGTDLELTETLLCTTKLNSINLKITSRSLLYGVTNETFFSEQLPVFG